MQLPRVFDERTNVLSDRMNRLFDDFASSWGLAPGRGTDFAPSLDISETDDAVHVRAEVPGMDPGDIEVSVTGSMLTLRGEKRTEEEQKGESFHRMERRYGAFVRTVELPASIDAGKVDATCRNGVLVVRLPKREEARPKSIQVKVEP